MTALVWDQAGEREFETGIDRGVLYPPTGPGVAWNGLTGAEDTPSSEFNSHYVDGRMYLMYLSPGDFSGRLTAYTYPEEFDAVCGLLEVTSGLFHHDQPAKFFGLSYRTRIGNDLDGTDHAYRIHVLYNLLATPEARTSPTIGEQIEPVEFAWVLSGKPPALSGHRPTAHVSVDSRQADVSALEDALYGTSSTSPYLPAIGALEGLL